MDATPSDSLGLAAPTPPAGARAAQVVVPCRDVTAMLEWLRDRLGMRVEYISPADDPATIVCGSLGTRLRLVRDDDADPATAPQLVVVTDDPAAVSPDGAPLVAPNGSRVTVVPTETPLVIPPEIPVAEQRLIVTHAPQGFDAFHVGRAGMTYRDLIPGRLGGRFIASHIRVPGGGLLGDWVHHHHIRFQMIYCAHGWVRVAYEDQGDPIIMHAGDCVLQPPHIRHRVLECSDGMEVIEVGCPAVHDTIADQAMSLPTGKHLPDRLYGGQQFVFHVAANALWHDSRFEGFDQRDIGFGPATDGLAGARVLRPAGALETVPQRHDAELVFDVVLAGEVQLEVEGEETVVMHRGDAAVIPADRRFRWCAASPDLELLDVTLPDLVPTRLDG